jgi:multidrug efflux pump subunit AcrA (membrane-fusion protein)
MTATAVIQLDRKDDVVRVPNSAVQSQNGVTYVRVMKNGEMNMVEVQTGLAADDYTEITSGIKEGDTVVTSVATVSTSTTGLTSSPFSTGNRGFGGAARSGGGQQTIMIR